MSFPFQGNVARGYDNFIEQHFARTSRHETGISQPLPRVTARVLSDIISQSIEEWLVSRVLVSAIAASLEAAHKPLEYIQRCSSGRVERGREDTPGKYKVPFFLSSKPARRKAEP